VAGFSVVHFLVDASGHEASATLTEGGVSALEYCPGLSVVLNHLSTKSDAEQYDCFGRTPLLHAIAEKRTKAAEKLVAFRFLCLCFVVTYYFLLIFCFSESVELVNQ